MSEEESNLDDIYCKICQSCGEDGCCPASSCLDHKDGLYCKSNILELKSAYWSHRDIYNYIIELEETVKDDTSKLEFIKTILTKMDEIVTKNDGIFIYGEKE